jgi:hypothetical protein
MAFDRRSIVPIARYEIDIYDRRLMSYLYYIDLFYRSRFLIQAQDLRNMVRYCIMLYQTREDSKNQVV